MGQELFGVDVAGIVADSLGPGLPDVILHSAPSTKTGARDPANLAAGRAKGAETNHTAKGFIADFSPSSVDGDRIKPGDRKGIILGDTIERGAVPKDGDGFTAEGVRYFIHRVLSRDPAAATYTLQLRDL